jgi:hypothetical protein
MTTQALAHITLLTEVVLHQDLARKSELVRIHYIQQMFLGLGLISLK